MTTKMVPENKEEILNLIVEFIKNNRRGERRLSLQTFYGEGDPQTLLSWNETGETIPWFFMLDQVEEAFSQVLLSFGEAVGFCKRKPAELTYGFRSPTMSNFKGPGHFMEGVSPSIPNAWDIRAGSCVVTQDIFEKHQRVEITIKTNRVDYGQCVYFKANGDLKPLLAELLYPIVTVGLGGTITYEFVEAFIGWVNSREDI
ncbi:MAG: hypothetical protein ACRCTP_04365 [Aeromonas popoffii]|uniref:hypothetical protein n=1 Tax=Aeromonas popoffii TaxID=70856 RepID=UPI003F381442